MHRIGRTGRAGATGIAMSLCDSSERPRLRAIEKLIRRPISVMQVEIDASQRDAAPPRRRVNRGRRARVNPRSRANRPAAARQPIRERASGNANRSADGNGPAPRIGPATAPHPVRGGGVAVPVRGATTTVPRSVQPLIRLWRSAVTTRPRASATDSSATASGFRSTNEPAKSIVHEAGDVGDRVSVVGHVLRGLPVRRRGVCRSCEPRRRSLLSPADSV